MSAPKNMTPAQRQLRASTAALTRWAWTNEDDRKAATQPGMNGLLEKFAKQIDPDGLLPPDERQRRAETLRKAHMRRLALRSSQKRAARKLSSGQPGREA